MLLRDMMTAKIEDIPADATLMQAAERMKLLDIGAIPVRENDRLVGMITDRDIAVRAVAEGRGPETLVRETMTDKVEHCFEDDDVEEVAMKMSDSQVRRFPVLNRADHRLTGIVSLGDLSRSRQSEAASIALDGITDPGGPHDQSTETR